MIFAECIHIYIFTTAFRLTGDFVSTGLGKVEEETAEYTKSAERITSKQPKTGD